MLPESIKTDDDFVEKENSVIRIFFMTVVQNHEHAISFDTSILFVWKAGSLGQLLLHQAKTLFNFGTVHHRLRSSVTGNSTVTCIKFDVLS